jgi:hypothetical protein
MTNQITILKIKDDSYGEFSIALLIRSHLTPSEIIGQL